MPKSSQKKIDTVVAYNRAHGSITIRPTKEVDQQIRQAAQAAGQPLQRWIIDKLLAAIRDDKRI